MTTQEQRLLYLLRKHGGRANRSTLAMATSRLKRVDRERTLGQLEELGLISSADVKIPGKKGAPSIEYWLTDVGNYTVDDLIETGQMRDPHAA